jgi:hypothetical protein
VRGVSTGGAWSYICDAELQSRFIVRQELAVAVMSRVEVGGATVSYCHGEMIQSWKGRQGMEIKIKFKMVAVCGVKWLGRLQEVCNCSDKVRPKIKAVRREGVGRIPGTGLLLWTGWGGMVAGGY